MPVRIESRDRGCAPGKIVTCNPNLCEGANQRRKSMEDRLVDQYCKTEIATERHFREEIPGIVENLVGSCANGECFDHVGPEPIPSREAVMDIVGKVRRLLYPGYFIKGRLEKFNLAYYFGQEATALFELMSEQLALALRHDCIRHDLSCVHCEELGQEATVNFMRDLSSLRLMLATDVRAAYQGDPAAKSFDEIIFSYPGLFAVTVHRMAHQLWEQRIPLIPRIITEYAHGVTGIDIHPGAHIGESFFIDHGTGVVVGETTQIGDRVRLYQGVTLGALSLPRDAGEQLRDKKRHPTIQDDVIIYSGATILGGNTVIGSRSVIGGNVWLTESVPPDTRVMLKKPELIYTGQPEQGKTTE